MTKASILDEAVEPSAPAVQSIIADLRLLVADASGLFRGGLIALLSNHCGFRVVGEASSGREAVAEARRLRPALAIIELDLPDLDGIEIARRLRLEAPGTAVLLLSSHNVAASLERAVASGVRGLMRKTVQPSRLISALKEIGNGGCAFDSTMVMQALQDRGEGPTASERRVLACIAEGHTVRDVARRLSLSEGTVRNYVSSVIRKAQARNRIDAIRIAREMGWI